MGAKTSGSGGQGYVGGMPGGDVQPFAMPPTQQPGGQMPYPQQNTGYPTPSQRKYTPEEWSRIYGPNVEPNPSMIEQGPQTPFDPMTVLRGLGNRSPGVGGNPFAGGQGQRPQVSDDDYLRMLYQTELGREGEQGGMDYWRQQMAGGMNRDQVRQMFDRSQEGQGYNQRMAPMMDDFGYTDESIQDALRMARLGPQAMEDRRMAQQQNAQQQGSQLSPNISQALALLGRLGIGG